MSGQGRLLAAGFLGGDEISVGTLPEQEQLFVGPGGRRRVGLGLGTRRSQQTEAVVGDLRCPVRAFAQGDGAIASAGLKVETACCGFFISNDARPAK